MWSGGWPCSNGLPKSRRVCRLDEPGMWSGGWPCVMGFRSRVMFVDSMSLVDVFFLKAKPS